MAQAKMNRKQEKKMKENLLMLEDERRHADQYKEQAEKVITRRTKLCEFVKHVFPSKQFEMSAVI